MRNVIIAMLMGISFGTFRCNPLDALDDPNLITSLRFTPSAFDSFKRNTELKYNLSDAASINAYIVSRDSAHNELYIKTLVEGLSQTKGAHSITWIGDTDERLFAPAGIYFGVLRVKNQRFEAIIQIFHF